MNGVIAERGGHCVAEFMPLRKSLVRTVDFSDVKQTHIDEWSEKHGHANETRNDD